MYTVYDHMYGNSPAKDAVHSPYIRMYVCMYVCMVIANPSHHCGRFNIGISRSHFMGT
jgi:hypothetical protein